MQSLMHKICLWCADSFTTIYETKIYCSRPCKERAKQARKNQNYQSNLRNDNNQKFIRRVVQTFYLKRCKNCDEWVKSTKSYKIYCDDYCANMYRETAKRQRNIRAFKKNTAPNIVARLYYRDKGICGICKTSIDLTLIYPHPMSLSIDHIVPISLGGTNLQSNLQPSHLVCNSKRGNKPLL